MSVPANMLNFGAMPPIPRELPAEIQAQLLAMRLGMPPPVPGQMPPQVNFPIPPEVLARMTPPGEPAPPMIPPGTGPLNPNPSEVQPPAPMTFSATPAVPQGNVPYREGMAPQRPAAPIGAVLDPQADIPVDPFQGPPEPEREPPNNGPQTVAASPEQQKAGRLRRWKDFIQRFKTDPDVRMAVFQSTLALTQPSENAPASIGQALNVGARTMEQLRTQRVQEGRQAASDRREERQVAATEAGVNIRRRDSAAQRTQHKEEMDLRLKQLEQDAAYQKELLAIRRLEAGDGSGQGQVNQRWTQLTQALLAQPDADLLRFENPKERENRARLRAFDAISGAGQTRQKFIADEIARQQIFSPDQGTPEYDKWIQDLVTRVSSYADAAGLFDERVAPTTAQPALPPGITEEQLQHTMKKYSLTREQVLARLTGG